MSRIFSDCGAFVAALPCAAKAAQLSAVLKGADVAKIEQR